MGHNNQCRISQIHDMVHQDWGYWLGPIDLWPNNTCMTPARSTVGKGVWNTDDFTHVRIKCQNNPIYPVYSVKRTSWLLSLWYDKNWYSVRTKQGIKQSSSTLYHHIEFINIYHTGPEMNNIGLFFTVSCMIVTLPGRHMFPCSTVHMSMLLIGRTRNTTCVICCLEMKPFLLQNIAWCFKNNRN